MILVNLTCGRNPWKRADTEDCTFNAFLRDPQFLKSILPINDQFNYVLSRIFECNPSKRATIPELRNMLMSCTAFTTMCSSPSIITPPSSPFIPQDCITTTNHESKMIEPPIYDLCTQDCSSTTTSPILSTPPPSPSAPTQFDRSQRQAVCSLPPNSYPSSYFTWYTTFAPALDLLAQKQFSLQPFLSGVRVL